MATRLILWFVPALAVLGATSASATEVVLHTFRCPLRGANPASGLIRDSTGNFYGTTIYGGTANYGVVYKLGPHGQETVLYNFTGGADGANPTSGLIQDSAGNLYGTTPGGGTAGAGVIYKVDTTGHQTVLYSFTGGMDGNIPSGGVIRDSSGNLYGTTRSGGNAWAGVVYELDSTGRETVLYSFSGHSDGYAPAAGVIRDSAGNLYGTTGSGGAYGQGNVYKLDTVGHESVLYSFLGGTDGWNPDSALVRDPVGNFYGTTFDGGSYNGVRYTSSTVPVTRQCSTASPQARTAPTLWAD